MGVENIIFGEEEYRESSPWSCSIPALRYLDPCPMLTHARTRLRPPPLPSSSDRPHAFILHTKRCHLVSILPSTRLSHANTGSHLPTHQFLARNVKLSAFDPSKIGDNYRLWKNGGTPSLRIYGKSLFPAGSR
jgi:hypothetical protein